MVFSQWTTGRSQESGQIALVVILLMVGVLIIGLSLASQSAQDLLLTTSEVESNRVFNAAEAGVEEALSQGFDFTGAEQIVNLEPGFYDLADVQYQVTKNDFLDTLVLENSAIAIDVSTAGSVGSPLLNIDWSTSSNCALDNPASLVISVYYDDAGTTAVRHYALAGCDRADGFTLVGASGQAGYSFGYQLPLTGNDLLVRIRPVYNKTTLRVTAANFTLPTEMYSIRSQAKNTRGEESRAVLVKRGLPAQPSVMDFALVSGVDIVK